METWAMFLGGLLGSGHCIGMCGGFALSVGAICPRLPAGLIHQALYSAGRIFTYAFLGFMAAIAGSKLSVLGGSFATAQQALAAAAGIMMIGFGASALGLLPWRRVLRTLVGRIHPATLVRTSSATSAVVTTIGLGQGAAVDYGPTAAASFFGHFLHPRTTFGVLLAGVFTGFLPCGLVYGFLVLAGSTSDPLAGGMGMAFFGLGTVPAMVLVGCGGSVLTLRWRARVQRAAAVFVLILGMATLYRGIRTSPTCCEPAPRLAS